LLTNTQGWNLRHLDTLLSSVLEEKGFKLPGVNTPYLYFGQWRSVFAWYVAAAGWKVADSAGTC
jgi:hypothetical protein